MILKLFRRLRNLYLGLPYNVSVGGQLKFERGSSVTFGKNVKLGNSNTLTARGGKILLGDNFNTNDGVILNADIGGKLTFGENCLVGPGCIFRTANHMFQNPHIPIRDQGHEVLDISIGNDVWFGAKVVVLPGVSIGNGCVVGASAVVTKSFDDFTILAGVPASPIGSRKT
jgi:acetyltransferase-like isoleucine patch superfamily enzyme